MVTVSTESSQAEWDAYVGQHPDGTVDHLWGWQAVFQRAFGHDSRYLVARRAGAVVGVLPLVLFRSRLFGRSVVSVPFLNYGGVLADDGDVSAQLVARAREIAADFRASHVELRHQARQCPDLPSRQHKLGLSRSLPATADALWTTIDRKVRNQVRKAQKEDLTIAVGGPELIDGFYQVFSRNMRDLGTPVYSKALFVETFRAFPERVRFYVVKRGAQVIAGAVTIRLGGTVLVPWASALREFRHLSPNMLLYWTMLESAIAAGATRFDFGRSSPDAGTHHFKLQWGAEEIPLHWEYVLLTREAAPDHGPSNPKFERAIALWQRCPLWLANAIGPHIVRGIP